MATINVTELAEVLSTDPRTARKFLRSITPKDAQPGKGARWSIEKAAVKGMRSKFAQFTAAQDAARAKREANAEDAPEVEESTESE